jgi:uncharacterized protein (TIGR03083 family)
LTITAKEVPMPEEGPALVATLDEVAPSRPTACAGWTVHDIVAHLAAGSKEIADLIADQLAGKPSRPTQAFEDREPPFRALPDDELWSQWAYHSQRKNEAVAALAARGEDARFEFTFTGTCLTAGRIATHSRSEAAVHRWDIAGDDATSAELLAQPELTAHAVSVLNAMPVLSESSRARMGHAGRAPFRIVLRAADRPDVVLGCDVEGEARFELIEDGPAQGDAVLVTDPAHRLLILWGRKSAKRPASIEADPATDKLVSSVLWPDAVPWS